MLPVWPWSETPAIAMALEAEAGHPVERFEARVSGGFPGFAAAKEVVVCLLNAAQRDLLRRAIGNNP
jgi:hypothetical protein